MINPKSESQVLPRVLWIADEIPQSAYAGGILLKRLFTGYPVDHLFVVGEPPHPEAELLPVRYERLKLNWARLNTTRFAKFARSLHALGILPSCTTPSKETFGCFVPEVVLTLMRTLPYCETAAKYARLHNLPLVTLVHDMPGEFDKASRFTIQSQQNRLRAIYRQSQRRLCISPEMASCLEEKYGVPGEVLYPNRSENIKPRPLEYAKTFRCPGTFTIGYAGSLNYGYGETLDRLCEILPEGTMRLNYYGYENNALFGRFGRSKVNQRGFKPAEATWKNIQEECDAVILPYSFAEQYKNLYSTHFPSKLPEYLALNMPVMVVGPTYATGVRWALKNANATLASTKNHPATWVTDLQALAASTDKRIALAVAAYAAGERDFRPDKLKAQFLSVITEVALKPQDMSFSQ